jgi:hypothetical protein
MKKIYKSLLFTMIAVVPFLTSCKDDNDSNPTLSIPTSFVLNTPEMAANNVYDLPYGTVNLTASQPNYGGWPAAVYYAVQVSLDGSNWTELPTIYSNPSMSIEGYEINDVVLPLYREANNDEDPASGLPVFLRSRAFLGDTGMNFAEVYSNNVSIKVYAWEAPQELALPTNIFVCGGSIADAWSTWKPVPLIWTKEGQFYTLIYNNADGFKWGNKPNDWFGYDMIDEFDNQVDGLTISTDGDGNIVFDKAGWYVLKFVATIDGKKLKYKLTVAPGKAFAIGAAVDNGSWSGVEMTPPDSKDGYWTFSDFTGAGELRAYIVVPGVDWWQTEFTILNGNGELIWRDAEHNSDSNWKDDVGEEYSVSVGPGKIVKVNFDRSVGIVEDL